MPWDAFLFRMTICAFLPSSDSHSVQHESLASL